MTGVQTCALPILAKVTGQLNEMSWDDVYRASFSNDECPTDEDFAISIEQIDEERIGGDVARSRIAILDVAVRGCRAVEVVTVAPENTTGHNRTAAGSANAAACVVGDGAVFDLGDDRRNAGVSDNQDTPTAESGVRGNHVASDSRSRTASQIQTSPAPGGGVGNDVVVLDQWVVLRVSGDVGSGHTGSVGGGVVRDGVICQSGGTKLDEHAATARIRVVVADQTLLDRRTGERVRIGETVDSTTTWHIVGISRIVRIATPEPGGQAVLDGHAT